jgi:hypothetical protein
MPCASLEPCCYLILHSSIQYLALLNLLVTGEALESKGLTVGNSGTSATSESPLRPILAAASLPARVLSSEVLVTS